MENNDKQTIIYNIRGNMNNYPTAATVNNYYYNQPEPEKEALGEEKEDINDELYAILQDKELYEETVKWAKTCKKPSDIKNRITTPLKRSGFTNFNKDFIEALLPHMTNYEGKPDYRTIQRALY